MEFFTFFEIIKKGKFPVLFFCFLLIVVIFYHQTFLIIFNSNCISLQRFSLEFIYSHKYTHTHTKGDLVSWLKRSVSPFLLVSVIKWHKMNICFHFTFHYSLFVSGAVLVELSLSFLNLTTKYLSNNHKYSFQVSQWTKQTFLLLLLFFYWLLLLLLIIFLLFSLNGLFRQILQIILTSSNVVSCSTTKNINLINF